MQVKVSLMSEYGEQPKTIKAQTTRSHGTDVSESMYTDLLEYLEELEKKFKEGKYVVRLDRQKASNQDNW